MKILKFGGSSVADAELIKNVVAIIESFNKEPIAVVVSALGGLTDVIIAAANLASEGKSSYLNKLDDFIGRNIETATSLLNKSQQKKALPLLEENHQYLREVLHGVFLVKELTNRTLDYIMSFGERNSAFIIACYLEQKKQKAYYLDARKVIVTDSNFGKAKVNFGISYGNIQKHFDKNSGIAVITGFIASNKDGVTTTLGRSGSDYTAAIFAGGLNAKEIQIWTDVDGVMTADPRKVKAAFTQDKLTYNEAMEMSHFGAKVIHPPTIQPAMDKRIPIRIKNTFNPEFAGSLIKDRVNTSKNIVRGISSIAEIALLTIQGSGLRGVPGTAGRLFTALAIGKVNIILITQGSSEHSITFAIDPGGIEQALNAIEQEFNLEMNANLIEPVMIEKELSIVAVVGENMKNQPGISGKVYHNLGTNGINVVAAAQGSSELNISVVIEQKDEQKALNSLHETFFESDTKNIHLFAIGTGLIGSTMFRQFKDQQKQLKEDHNIEVKLIGLANSRKMIFNRRGMSFNNCTNQLMEKGLEANMQEFVWEMKSMNLRNSIFVDNSASSAITDLYEEILQASISISTANKIAASSKYKSYRNLKDLARLRNVQFQYETNVGAGLPLLTTIKDLLTSGDKIIKIEGVLSGSLSFIFNNFEPGKSFSSIVKQAKEKGFTEPDPREDLSGADVKRKLLILAREAGLKMEDKEIRIKSILPAPCREAKSVEAFFKELEKADAQFDKLVAKATKAKKALRFIATLEGTKAFISLQQVANDHPFYSLSGSDNMVVITTERYKLNPLVIRGPGAGPEVTAAGVFAEIIRIGKTLN